MAKSPRKPRPAHDHMATRELHEAISRRDAEAVRRALARNADPNDQKRLASWQPASTPLLEAATRDFPAAITLLLKHGAKRRASGKDGQSAFAIAILNNSRKAFQALLTHLGAMTQPEIIECFLSLHPDPSRTKPTTTADSGWGGVLLDTLAGTKTRMAARTAYIVAMNFLGGRGSQSFINPPMVQSLLDHHLLPPNTLAYAARIEGLPDLAVQLERRNWTPTPDAVDLLHDLGFPFAAALAAYSEATPATWLVEQKAVQEQRLLLSSTPLSPTAPRRARL